MNTVYRDETPPAVSANPPGGSFMGTQDVSITCTDVNGSGCSKIVYSKDGSAPSLTSSTSTIVLGNAAYTTMRCDDTLQFYAVDMAGNVSVTVSETYSNGTACCVNNPTCTADETVCYTPSPTTNETPGCWADVIVHFCLCGSGPEFLLEYRKPCYTTTTYSPVCSTTPGTCTDNWTCNY